MKEVYVIGHKSPDLDSIASSISYSFLKNRLDKDTNYIPAFCGSLNEETKYILDEFNIEKPLFLNDLKTRMSDVMKYPISCFKTDTIYDCIIKMIEYSVDTLVVIDENRKVEGIVTIDYLSRALIRNMITKTKNNISVHVDWLSKKSDSIFKYKNGNFLEGEIKFFSDCELEKLSSNDVLIISSKNISYESFFNKDYDLNSLIVVNSNEETKNKFKSYFEKNYLSIDYNIILSSLDMASIIQFLFYSQSIDNFMKEDFSYFLPDDHIDESREEILNKDYSIPILNQEKNLLGVVGKKEVLKHKEKNVVLVDHNQYSLGIDGLDENANIVEIIDHHKLGDIRTIKPVNIEIDPVGSTATLIYEKFIENKVDIPYNIGILLLSAILSDTIILTSPTTTNRDKKAVNSLSKNLDMSYKKLGKKIFESNNSLFNKEVKTLLLLDKKTYDFNDNSFFISQLQVVNIENLINRKNEFIKEMNNLKKNKDFDYFILMLTDVVEKKSYILSKPYFNGFNNFDEKNGFNIVPFMSRKRELIPYIYNYITN